MAKQSFEALAETAAPPAVVFALLADSTGWRKWAGPLIRESTWDREGQPAPGGVGAVRKLGGRPVYSREEIVVYDPPHHLGYVMVSGPPVRGYRADVYLTESSGGTRITWRATFTPLIPGTGSLLRLALGGVVRGFTRRLADYAARQVASS